MPATMEWKTFAGWGHKWGRRLLMFYWSLVLTSYIGGIIYLNLIGQPMIIVNSASIMEEMDKKGSIYSDRPRLEFGGEMIGYSKTLVLMPYGARFRNFRKYIAKMIGTSAATQRFAPMEELETHRFLKRVLTNADDLVASLRKLVFYASFSASCAHTLQDFWRYHYEACVWH